MNIVDLIIAKRDGARLSDEQLRWVIDAYTTTDRYPYGERADTNQATGRA